MAIIREISSLCNQLPVLNTLEMQESSSNVRTEVALCGCGDFPCVLGDMEYIACNIWW